MAKREKKTEPSFRDARERLDEILDELEADTGDVDQLAARVKEAAGLIRTCREKLSAARHDVTAVVAELAAEEQRTADVAEAPAAPSGAPAVAADDDEPEPEPPPGYGSDDVVEDDLPF